MTFRSHLGGTLEGDPTLSLGERIRVVPAADERTLRRDVVLVTLPASTAYTARLEQYYLRGFAVGYATGFNQQFM